MSTEYPIIKSGSRELSVTERSNKFDLAAIKDDYVDQVGVEFSYLTLEQLEAVALKLLLVCSYYHPRPTDFLRHHGIDPDSTSSDSVIVTT